MGILHTTFLLLVLSAKFLAVHAESKESNFPNYVAYAQGFDYPRFIASVGGRALCVEGEIQVPASAMNTQLKYQDPANQTVVTETILEFLQVNSTKPAEVIGGSRNVSGTYKINGQLCWPKDGQVNATLVQFLTHGVGFDKSYWNFFNEHYSYVDNAAEAGYTTFLYDRLGNGQSEHPDPIQVIQAPLEIGIAHSLVQMLRDGRIGSAGFSHVVGVGHSLGSELTNAITGKYPRDFDAAVLTGFSVEIAGISNFFSGLNLVIASENQPSRFSDLPNGYLVSDNIAGNQFGFLRSPNFENAVLMVAETMKGTFTIGELFTGGRFVSPAPAFIGPIDVVIGQFDLPFCQSNCLVPNNKAEAVRSALYTNASRGSQHYIVNGAGHGINLHYEAPKAYQHIFGFLAANGFEDQEYSMIKLSEGSDEELEFMKALFYKSNGPLCIIEPLSCVSGNGRTGYRITHSVNMQTKDAGTRPIAA